jgi:tRNA A37 methylthiotransferase MiaB
MNDIRIQINKKLVGKHVKVLVNDSEWIGEVIGVKDEETFIVSNGEASVSVDIFDIRSLN